MAQANFMEPGVEETPEDIGNSLAAERAKKFKPYEDETEAANDNASPAEPADDNQPQPYTSETDAPETANDNDSPEQIALDLASNKQEKLMRIQKKKQELEEELTKLEEALTKFKTSKLGGFLKIFQHPINLLIDTLLEQIEKQKRKMADKARIALLTGAIITISSLIIMLTALKIMAAFLDAVIVDKFSCGRACFCCLPTIIIPIIIILISPLWIMFLGLIFFIGVIPLLKGVLTKNVIALIKDLKKRKAVWQEELAKLKKKVALRKQIKDLRKMEKQVKRGR